MNFEFSREQEILREQARAFLIHKCSTTVVRRILEGNDRFAKDVWAEIAALGWQATVIPEEYGGLGLSHFELAVIAEELGRALAPVPFSSSIYLAAEILLRHGSTAQKRKWLPMLASGECIGTVALAEDSGRLARQRIRSFVQKGYLTGQKIAVCDGDCADFVIVLARSRESDELNLYCVEARDVEREPVEAIDPTRSHANLRFNSSPAELIGPVGMGWDLVNSAMDRAAILLAWEQVGGTESALEQVTQYAKTRMAFGRYIGSFQTNQNKIAQMYVKHTLARSNCYWGTWTLANDHSDLSIAAATSRVSATQAFDYASKENIQIHGGAGFTWEYDCHLYYRRAKLLALTIGSEQWWEDRLMLAFERQNRVA